MRQLVVKLNGAITAESVPREGTVLISSHILSEIALLADDIGIIGHGTLLEEESLEDYFKRVTGGEGIA